MLVRESISFTRGTNPKDTLGIGEKHLLYKPSLINLAQKLIKKYNHFLIDSIYEYDKEPNLFEVSFLDAYKDNIYFLGYDTMRFIFRWYSKFNGDEEEYNTIKDLEERLIEVLNHDSHIKIEESMSFQRGGDPKEILGIGYEHKFHVKEIMDALQDIVNESSKKDTEIKIRIKNEDEFAAGFDWLEDRPFDRAYWRYLLGFNKEGYYTSSYQKLYSIKVGGKRTIHDSEGIQRCIKNIKAWLYNCKYTKK